MPEHIERTCKNCLHIAVCYRHEHYGWEETNAGCNDFKSAADVVKVVHGEWVENITYPNAKKLFCELGFGVSETMLYYTCSCCNSLGSNFLHYCSHCGVKMDGKRD